VLLPNAVSPAIMEERRERLRELEIATGAAYRRSLLGRRLDVLVEGADPLRPGHAQGSSCRYVPVSFRGHAPALLRKRVPVRAVAVEAGVIVGEPEVDAMPTARRPLPLTAS
jgi:tRNA A37 methylthiotransferase MiaB